MKLLLFSDLHAHEFSDFSHIDEKTGLNSRLLWCVRVIHKIRKEAVKRGIKHVLFGGDLFHVRGIVRVPVLQSVGSAFFRLARETEVTILAGNHDQSDKEGTHVASAVFKRKKIEVVSKWKILPQFPHSAAFAYDWKPDRLRANLKKAYDKGVRHLFMHVGIHGAQTGPRDFIPREEIDPDEFKRFRRVFTGHYHKGQDIGRNITYIGSALQHYRSEMSYKTGFIVYDFEDNTYERVPIRTPRFRRWEAESDDRRVRGNYVDAVLPKGWSVDRLQSHLEKLGVAAVNILPVERERREAEKRLQIDTSTDKGIMLRRYAKKFHGKLNLKKLISLGQDIVE